MPSLYVVLEKPIPNTDASVNGNSLSQYNKQIEAIAKRVGVMPLMSFFRASADELAAFAEAHGVGMDRMKAPEEKWFTAEEGLRTVNTLLRNAASLPGERLEEELREFQRVLEFAQSSDIRWHLAVDY